MLQCVARKHVAITLTRRERLEKRIPFLSKQTSAQTSIVPRKYINQLQEDGQVARLHELRCQKIARHIMKRQHDFFFVIPQYMQYLFLLLEVFLSN